MRRESSELRELARTQRAVQRLLAPRTPRLGCGAASRRDARTAGCDLEQIAVYRRMGELRFVREVAREFPATRALLGAARFDAHARAFTASERSTAYTLDGYARAFPQRLARSAAARRDDSLAAAAELARLERECGLVRMASEVERPRGAGVPLAQARLARGPGARVLRLRFDVEATLARFERGVALGAVARATTHVALCCRAQRVVRVRVALDEAPLLRALLRGETLERAVACADAAGLAPAAIGEALTRWVAAGLLAAVRA